MSKKIIAAFLAVCMIVGLIAVPAFAADDGFTDVPEDHWAADAIQRWAGYGVLTGHGDGTFTPEKQMTRAEFASMLVNMLGLTEKSDETFPDVKEDAWYAEVISIAIKAGILTGDNGNARPSDFVTFNEAVVMMCRAFGLKPAADTEDVFSDAADWAKDALNVLASMGAISASEDEQINPAMSFDRAAVAAIADKVVAEYVDTDTVIEGKEITGVVLVVKGASVELKDSTVSAPIVVESAAVTLTNTTAQDVKVGGTEAAVTADADSKVENVTLSGEAPKADIQCEVATITIAAGATEAVVEAPKAAEDAIVNNSTSDATVNGETVEGKPEETTEPDDTTDPDAEGGEGSVSGGNNIPPSNATDPATDEREGTATTSPSGGTANTPATPEAGSAGSETEVPEGNTACTGAHTWGTVVVTKEPTCTQTGTATYTCTVDTCGAVNTVTIPALGHTTKENSAVAITKAATCTAKGTKTYTCANPGCSYVVATEDIDALGHEFDDRYDHTSTLHWVLCEYCGTIDASSRAPHEWGEGVVTTEATTEATGIKTFTCVCGATKTEVIPKLPADPSESPSESPEPSESPSESPEPSESPSVSPEPSESPSGSPEPSGSPSPSPSQGTDSSESPEPSSSQDVDTTSSPDPTSQVSTEETQAVLSSQKLATREVPVP